MDGTRNDSGPEEGVTPQAPAPRKQRSVLFYVVVIASVLLAVSALGCALLFGSAYLVVRIANPRWVGAEPWLYVASRASQPASARSVALAPGFALAIEQDGTLWTWGDDSFGQLGQGSSENTQTSTPAQVGTGAGWSAVAVGGEHALALRSDGTLWAWGLNTHGQIGDGTLTGRQAPVRVGSETGWTQFAAGYAHSVALKSDGTLWAWGMNDQGQLGDGTTAERTAPVRVGSDADWRSVATGGSRTHAIKSDGSLWGWGENADGHVGVVGEAAVLEPTRIGEDSDWASVALSDGGTVGIKRDGTLWMWEWSGDVDTYGAHLPGGRFVPTRFETSTGWKCVGLGASHTVAVKTDGTLWAWGSMWEYGDHRGFSKVPVQVGKDTNWESVVADPRRWERTRAIKSDGSLWSIEQR